MKEGTITGNILKAAKVTTPEEAADWCTDIILASGKPDKVLERILHTLHKDFPEQLSHRTQRAVKHALVVLHKEDKPQGTGQEFSPVEVAARLAKSGQFVPLVADSPTPDPAVTGVVVVAPGADSSDAGDNDRVVPVAMESAADATPNGVAMAAA